MSKTKNKTALLLLADGTCFEGRPAGKQGTATGEICFNTGMTGYQEIFTDPSYSGQILVQTNAHIGNYGIHPDDVESDGIKISGLAVKNFTNLFSRSLANQAIQDYLEAQDIVAISDIDTRELVRHIRDKGAMNAIISSDTDDVEQLKTRLKKVPSMEGLELSSGVSTREPYNFGDENAKIKVAVLDLGVKTNILRSMAERGVYMKVFPAKTRAEEISSWNPDGFFMSNGPGDPAAMDYTVNTAAHFLENGLPVFGICLGHQVLARAVGIPTYKMHHGHRGANHPVINLQTGRSEITTQNHGFGVSPDAITANEAKVEVTHINLNDQTIEGIRIKGKNAFSVQYHPEASPGPHDSRYLFDDFVTMIKNN